MKNRVYALVVLLIFLSMAFGYEAKANEEKPLERVVVSQGTLIHTIDVSVQNAFNMLGKGDFGTVRYYPEDSRLRLGTLLITREFSSGEEYGIGGGKRCKEYKLIMSDRSSNDSAKLRYFVEVGTLCMEPALNGRWEYMLMQAP